MPLTVITLKNVPSSLRGDLSKWMQEISTGVYIGNFNSRIRGKLWERVTQTVKEGEATLSYADRNELGYSFKTFNSSSEVVYYDGLPLVLHADINKSKENDTDRQFYSDAAKFRNARYYSSVTSSNIGTEIAKDYVVLDIETDGLDEKINTIIEIGAIKVSGNKELEFHRFIKYDAALPEFIVELTGIKDELLKENGIPLDVALTELHRFIGDATVVGYKVDFDIRFINKFSDELIGKTLDNRFVDICNLVKKEKMFQTDYKLESSLKSYGIDGYVKHRALDDAKVTLQLARKVKGFSARL